MRSLNALIIAAGVITAALILRPVLTPAGPRSTGTQTAVDQTTSPDRYLAIARQIDDQLADRLETARTERPEAFDSLIARIGSQLLTLDELRETEDPLYGLKLNELRSRVQLDRDAEAWHQAVAAGDAERADELERRLRQQVQTQVLGGIATRGLYLLELEQDLENIRHCLDADAASFNEQIEERLAELLTQRDAD